MNNYLRCVVLLGIVQGVTQFGCSRSFPSAAGPAPATPAPAFKETGAPPTEQEAQEFAELMRQAVADNDGAAIDYLMRTDYLVKRLVSDFQMPADQRRAFIQGATNALKQNSFGKQILDSIQDMGSYRLLRIRMVDGRPRPVFRLVGAGGALNYHEYRLVRYDDGQVAAEDVYIYMSGELLSQTMRRVVIPALATSRKKGFMSKGESEELQSLKTLTTLVNEIRIGNFQSAIAAYQTLPKKFQEQKFFLLMYMQATMSLGMEGEADYLAAMQLFRDKYPEDSAIDFVSIDYFFLKKKFDEARQAVEKIDEAVGGDSYLNMYRANTWIEEGQYDKARQLLETSLGAESELAYLYWTRIALALREKNYDDTLKWLQLIVEKCRITIGDLTEAPDYTEFARTPQYRQWQQWNAKFSANQK